jgi:hypothetical protein
MVRQYVPTSEALRTAAAACAWALLGVRPALAAPCSKQWSAAHLF